MAAESENELNGPNNAYLINKVRERHLSQICHGLE